MAEIRSIAPRNRRGCIAIPGVTTFVNCKQPGVYADNAINRRINRVGDRRERYRFPSVVRGRRTRGGNFFEDIAWCMTQGLHAIDPKDKTENLDSN